MMNTDRHGDAARLLTAVLGTPALRQADPADLLRARAETWLSLGMERRAWADLDQLSTLRPDDLWARLQRQRLLGRHGDAEGPLSQVLAIARTHPQLALAWQVAEELSGDAPRLGLHAEIAIGRARSAPADVAATLRAAPLLVQRGEHDEALALIARCEQGNPTADPRLQFARAKVLFDARRTVALHEVLDRLTPRDAETATWLSAAWLRCGQPERALRTLRSLQASPPTGQDCAWRLASVQLACRLGQLDDAERIIAERPVAGLDDALLVALAARQDWPAIARLSAEPWSLPCSQVLVAEALRRASAGKDEVRRRLERAHSASTVASPTLLLNRLVVEPMDYLADACCDAFGPMLDGDPPPPGRERITWLRARADGLLDRLAGVRDDVLCWFDDAGAVHVHWPRPDLRGTLASLRQSLTALGMEGTIARYDALEREWGHNPYLDTYRAEVRLWAGDTAPARRDLDHALELAPKTRWAYVGHAVCSVLSGRPADALATLETAQVDIGRLPTAVPIRSEALLRLGQYAKAEELAVAALRHRPSRVSSWLILAAARLASGRDAADILAAFAHHYPDLWSISEGPDTASRIDAALLHMRGNRGSGIITWYDPRGWWMARQAVALLDPP